VNHKTRDSFTKHRFVSNELIQAIEQSLAHGEQALVFHNRRGTAPVVICEECGWRALCPHCELPLTFHGDALALRCHSCDHKRPIIHSCPDCHNPTIIFKGIGTQMVEQEFNKLFPKARIARFDADNAKDQQLQTRYQELYDKKIDILIGTQIIAKGLDIPGISTVGVLQADSGLSLPDFAANERTFQLLYQVSGRAGRSKGPGHVILQTYLPDSPIISWAAKKQFAEFAETELAQRRQYKYPPFRYLLKLTCAFSTEKGAVQAARKLAQHIRSVYPEVEVVGPAPDFYERKMGKFNWQVLVKSAKRPILQRILREVPPGSNWQADIDPVTLL
jgi:primosomal protein N' (replication factor Y)